MFQLAKCRKLIEIADKSLEEGTEYFYGIEACNEVLDGYGCDIGPTLKHDCLCTRAALLLKVLLIFCEITWLGTLFISLIFSGI